MNYRLERAEHREGLGWGILLALVTTLPYLLGYPVSYTHLTLPTMRLRCRSRWSPDH